MIAPTKHLQQGGEKQIASLNLHNQLKTDVDDRNQDQPDTFQPSPGAWNRRDLNDVSRLGTIIADFLATQPFRSDVAFNEAVSSHLRRKQIPFGAVRRLKYLMDSLMVKHRSVLPTLHLSRN